MRSNQKRLIVVILVLLGALLALLIPHGSAPEGSSFLDKVASNINLGLDIKGGALLEYQMSTDIEDAQQLSDIADRVVEVLRRRLDAAGFTEATVEKVTTAIQFTEDIPPVRIRVQIPGITDIDKAEQLVGTTGKLYFADVLEITENSEEPSIPSSLNLEVSKRRLAGAEPYYLKDIDFGDYYNGAENNVWYLISPKINVGTKYLELGGNGITDAKSQVNPNPQPGQGKFMVSLTFSRDGAETFRDITASKANLSESDIKKRLAIVLDESVIIAPIVSSTISNGEAVIEGIQTLDEAKNVAILVASGNLPVELEPYNRQILSPTLGRDVINASLWAGIAGLLIVMIYMFIIYGKVGLVADVALIYNSLVLFAAISITGSTLTLPGIAGIVLTIGMTVDGNILINERIKEELRLGKTPENAIDSAFSKVFWTIFDANITTILTGLVLFYFGTGTVKGFAITLIIGILGAMFTNLVTSRTMLVAMGPSINPHKYVKGYEQNTEGRGK